MDLLPSAEELRDHLVNHDVAVRQIIILGELLYMVHKSRKYFELMLGYSKELSH